MVGGSVVLVTGSSGLIGRAICHRLGSNGNRVVGLDREGPPNPPPQTDCIFADLESDESVQGALFRVEQVYGKRIDTVIHLAAYCNFSGEDSNLYDKITYEGTKRLFRELERFEVGQFIFSSTMLVHAPTTHDRRINENSPQKATWAYPASKIKTEKLIQEIHGNIPTVVLRIAGVYTDLCQSIPIANQIQRIYEDRLISHFYPGDLDSAESFVHLDDLVDSYVQVMEKRDSLPPYSVILIGETDAMTYWELQQQIGVQLNGNAWTTQRIPKTAAKTGAWLLNLVPIKHKHTFIQPWMVDRADDNYILDTSKAQRELGWIPKRSLRSTLPQMIAGLKVDPWLWYRINKLDLPERLAKTDTHQDKAA